MLNLLITEHGLPVPQLRVARLWYRWQNRLEQQACVRGPAITGQVSGLE